jgi:integrase/recombinase XerC
MFMQSWPPDQRGEGLNVLPVDEHYGRVTISAGKGGKWQMVYMNTDLLNAYREWMKHRGEVETDRLFVTSKEKPLTRQAIHQQLEKYFKVLGTKKSPLTACGIRSAKT